MQSQRFKAICIYIPTVAMTLLFNISEGLACESRQFACSNDERCIPISKFCDGSKDCADGSDEPYRTANISASSSTVVCRRKTHMVTRRVCILPSQLSVHEEELCQGSTCKFLHEFPCADGSQCIPKTGFCNGMANCQDRSDEIYHYISSFGGRLSPTMCRRNDRTCNITTTFIKDKELFCESDNCASTSFACQDGHGCIDNYQFCDGKTDCGDGSDEPPYRYRNTSYDTNTRICHGILWIDDMIYGRQQKGWGTRICVLPQNHEPFEFEICQGSTCSEGEFSCLDGSQCVAYQQFCNSIVDCDDGSDEILRNHSAVYSNNLISCRGGWSLSHTVDVCMVSTEAAGIMPCENSDCINGEFSCLDGSQCIELERFCDGKIDCRDGSDEPSPRNSSNTYPPGVTFCRKRVIDYTDVHLLCVLPPHLVTHQEDLCDGSSCNGDEFACDDGSRCIAYGLFCDGNSDCSDGSDEPLLRQFNASYSPHDTPCRGKSESIKVGRFVCMLPKRLTSQYGKLCDGSSCKDDEFSCSDGSKCVSRRLLFCNGKPDCIDGSDEPTLRRENSSYDRNATLCRGNMGSFICVLPQKLVPQFDTLCADTLCTDDEFPCSDGSQCVSGESYCDGYVECMDGSDEPPLRNNTMRHDDELIFCRSKKDVAKFRPARVSRVCVLPPNHVRYKDKICAATSCRPDEFQCSDGSFCIEKKYFCYHDDEFSICRDKSDHKLFNNSIKYNSNVDFCRKTVHWGGRVCMLPEGEPASALDCEGSSCHSNEFPCDYGSKCFRMELYCDGHKHCSDGTDELAWTNGDMDTAGTSCRLKRGNDSRHSICVLPSNLAPYRGQLCGGFSCWVNEFPCANGRMCLPQSQYCNGKVECEDGSDEFKQPEKTNFSGRICHRQGNRCMIPDSHICDGFSFCDDDIDECLCPTNGNYRSDDKCFQCLIDTFMVLPISKHCNGVFDCRDLTDECLCSPGDRPEICENVLWDTGKPQLSTIECSVGRNESRTFIDASRVCDHWIDCPNGEDENNCLRIESPSSSSRLVKELNYECTSPVGKYATKCDGIVECDDFLVEECGYYCDSNPEYCEFIDIYSHYTGSYWSYFIPDDPMCDHIVTGKSFKLFRENMCDGESLCDNFADERGCESRFYCTDEPLPNIPIEKKCDKHNDCDNGADEKDCSHFRS